MEQALTPFSPEGALPKCPTGIFGFDDITGGGLPRRRTSIICGGPGCGKTLFGVEFLVRGALKYGEPGVLMVFEETEEEIAQNVASLGFDLRDLIARGLLYIDHVRLERSEIEETGDFDLEGLFVRLQLAIGSIGAKRVALDTLEVLFSGLPNETILRAEMRRLFRWLKDQGVTSVVTAERGQDTLTRYGLEEYVSDCVVLLDNRVIDQITTRRCRIIKYRGSSHGANEYPFLISSDGIAILPITSDALHHEVSSERLSTGVPDLDDMFEGAGVFRGSSVLITGTAGSGKTSLAAQFALASAQRGERCLYLAFEESAAQIIRNMRSIGADLQACIDEGLLHIAATRASMFGLEMHLVSIHRLIDKLAPRLVIVDPISNLIDVGDALQVQAMLNRLIDFLKAQGITAVLTSLTMGGEAPERTDASISSHMDTWILLKMIEADGERNRGLYVLKSRGMAHSNQIREMRLTAQGIRLADVYLGAGGVLTGAARQVQESQDALAALSRRNEIERSRRKIHRKRAALEARVAALQARYEAELEEMQMLIEEDEARNYTHLNQAQRMAKARGVEPRNGEAAN